MNYSDPNKTPSTQTRTPTYKPVTAEQKNIEWVGVRSSPYGITPFPDPIGWRRAISTICGYFPDVVPVGIWLVGEVFFDDINSGIDIGFPNPGGAYDMRIRFADTDKHESYLSYFDACGIQIFLQVESGYADMDDLIDVIFKQYGHHPCVIGFGVDVEWYRSQGNGCPNTPVHDDLAQVWERKVKTYNSNYRLFLKHFDRVNLPPTYRGDIIFVDDSEHNTSYSSYLTEMKKFADFFYPNDVIFQIGYASDKAWWSTLPAPIPQTIGKDLARQTQQTCGIAWVDFTLRDVLPTDQV